MGYREHPALNQSYLKNIPLGYGNKKILKGPAIKMGSLIDCLITTPSEYYETYYVADINVPPEGIKAILDATSEWETILEVVDLLDYKGVGNRKWKEPTVLAKLTEFKPYWESLRLSKGKEIVTTSEHEIATHVASLLTTHKETRAFIYHPDLEVIYQKDFYWYHKHWECKGLTDVLLINRGKEIIFANGYVFPANSYLIVDIKTGTKKPEKLRESMVMFNYYFQLAFYHWGLNIEGLTKLNPIIVYAQQSLRDYPIWYEFTNDDLEIGKKGLKEIKHWSNNKYTQEPYICGYEEAFELLEYYETNGQWPRNIKYEFRDIRKI